jgi:hypothetical protein
VSVAVVAEDRATKGIVPPPKPAASVVGNGAVVKLPGESLSGALVLPGETLSGDRIAATIPVAVPIHEPLEDKVIAITEATGTGDGTRRRRRRRRRGRGNAAEPIPLQPIASSPGVDVAFANIAADAEDGDDAESADLPAADVTLGVIDGAVGDNGEPKRRRRRRRRRGRGTGGEAVAQGVQPNAPVVPDRHIFRVSSDGAAHATGETAPKEPSRAIAPINRRPGHVAVEPPPPSLVAPIEPAAEIKVTTPARRRRGGAAAAKAPAQIESTTMRALPAPADDGAAVGANRPSGVEPLAPPNRATRTTTRGKAKPAPASPAATSVEPTPPVEPLEAILAAPSSEVVEPSLTAARTTRGAASKAAVAKKAPAKKVAARKAAAATAKATPARATAVKKAPAKKAALAKATTAKATTAKKSASSAKRTTSSAAAKKATAPAKKSPAKKSAAKKSTTTRKKS